MFNKTHAFDLAMVFFFVFFFFADLISICQFPLIFLARFFFSYTHWLTVMQTLTHDYFSYSITDPLCYCRKSTHNQIDIFPSILRLYPFSFMEDAKRKQNLLFTNKAKRKNTLKKKLNRTLAKNDENFLFSYFNLSPCLTLFSFHLFLTSFLALLFVSINCFNGSN